MSKPLSAASSKGIKQGSFKKELPSEGTKLRRLYDLLLTGEWLVLHELMGTSASGLKRQLQDFYNLELESRRGLHGGTRCIGIWDHGELIPLERLHLDS